MAHFRITDVLLALMLVSTSQCWPKGECPRGTANSRTIILPDHANCTVFYKCNYWEPVLYHCPHGLLFNSRTLTCDWPWNVACPHSKGRAESAITIPKWPTPLTGYLAKQWPSSAVTPTKNFTFKECIDHLTLHATSANGRTPDPKHIVSGHHISNPPLWPAAHVSRWPTLIPEWQSVWWKTSVTPTEHSKPVSTIGSSSTTSANWSTRHTTHQPTTTSELSSAWWKTTSSSTDHVGSSSTTQRTTKTTTESPPTWCKTTYGETSSTTTDKSTSYEPWSTSKSVSVSTQQTPEATTIHEESTQTAADASTTHKTMTTTDSTHWPETKSTSVSLPSTDKSTSYEPWSTSKSVSVSTQQTPEATTKHEESTETAADASTTHKTMTTTDSTHWPETKSTSVSLPSTDKSASYEPWSTSKSVSVSTQETPEATTIHEESKETTADESTTHKTMTTTDSTHWPETKSTSVTLPSTEASTGHDGSTDTTSEDNRSSSWPATDVTHWAEITSKSTTVWQQTAESTTGDEGSKETVTDKSTSHRPWSTTGSKHTSTVTTGPTSVWQHSTEASTELDGSTDGSSPMSTTDGTHPPTVTPESTVCQHSTEAPIGQDGSTETTADESTTYRASSTTYGTHLSTVMTGSTSVSQHTTVAPTGQDRSTETIPDESTKPWPTTFSTHWPEVTSASTSVWQQTTESSTIQDGSAETVPDESNMPWTSTHSTHWSEVTSVATSVWQQTTEASTEEDGCAETVPDKSTKPWPTTNNTHWAEVALSSTSVWQQTPDASTGQDGSDESTKPWATTHSTHWPEVASSSTSVWQQTPEASTGQDGSDESTKPWPTTHSTHWPEVASSSTSVWQQTPEASTGQDGSDESTKPWTTTHSTQWPEVASSSTSVWQQMTEPSTVHKEPTQTATEESKTHRPRSTSKGTHSPTDVPVWEHTTKTTTEHDELTDPTADDSTTPRPWPTADNTHLTEVTSKSTSVWQQTADPTKGNEESARTTENESTTAKSLPSDGTHWPKVTIKSTSARQKTANPSTGYEGAWQETTEPSAENEGSAQTTADEGSTPDWSKSDDTHSSAETAKSTSKTTEPSTEHESVKSVANESSTYRPRPTTGVTDQPVVTGKYISSGQKASDPSSEQEGSGEATVDGSTTNTPWRTTQVMHSPKPFTEYQRSIETTVFDSLKSRMRPSTHVSHHSTITTKLSLPWKKTTEHIKANHESSTTTDYQNTVSSLQPTVHITHRSSTKSPLPVWGTTRPVTEQRWPITQVHSLSTPGDLLRNTVGPNTDYSCYSVCRFNYAATLLPHPKNCSLYCDCLNEHPVVRECPHDKYFDAATKQCVNSLFSAISVEQGDNSWMPKESPSKRLICDAIGECPKSHHHVPARHLPHRTNCSLFCACDKGIPLQMECPAGLEFNPVLEVCDYPHRAGCLGKQTGSAWAHTPVNKNVLPMLSCDAVGSCSAETHSPKTVLLPHRTNCNLFCVCERGRLITQSCPTGLEFNPHLQVCDWPTKSGCSAKQHPTTQIPWVFSTEPHSAGGCDSVGTCNPIYSGVHTEYLPHRTNCTLYCRCENGVAYTDSCPNGMLFHPNLKGCVWPSQAKVLTAFTPTNTAVTQHTPPTPCDAFGQCPVYPHISEPKLLPHRWNSSLFCRCDRGVPVTERCPHGQLFDPKLQICDWPHRGDHSLAPTSATAAQHERTNVCDAKGVCPKHNSEQKLTLLPHKRNCSLFCTCVNGVPITSKCPPGLEFNAALSVCDWPDKAGCSRECPADSTDPTTVAPPVRCDAKGECPHYITKPEDAHLPHLTNCSLFCRCVNGVPITQKCPQGLEFNPHLKVCDLKHRAGCSTGTHWPLGSVPCDARGSCSSGLDRLPHRTNPHLYCRCDGGVAVTESCPPGEEFNEVLSLCEPLSHHSTESGHRVQDWLRANVEYPIVRGHEASHWMRPAAGHSTVNEHHVPDRAHPTSHHSTVNEHNGRDWAHPTAERPVVSEHHFRDWAHPTAGHSAERGHRISDPTHLSTRQPCDAVGECPRGAAKLLPHRTDCSLFCQCDHGVPVTARCPAGLEFNAALQVCDYPHRAGCSCGRSGAHHRTHH